MNIDRTTTFRQHYRERANKKLRALFQEKFLIFKKDPYNKSLRNHALSYRWKGHSSFSLDSAESSGMDFRVVFKKVKGGYLFVDFGTHDQLYRSWKK